jgi:hypothetical protein
MLYPYYEEGPLQTPPYWRDSVEAVQILQRNGWCLSVDAGESNEPSLEGVNHFDDSRRRTGAVDVAKRRRVCSQKKERVKTKYQLWIAQLRIAKQIWAHLAPEWPVKEWHVAQVKKDYHIRLVMTKPRPIVIDLATSLDATEPEIQTEIEDAIQKIREYLTFT